jgi:hypothetical protein
MLYLVNGWPYGNSFQKPFPPQVWDLVPNINGIFGVSVTNLGYSPPLSDTGIFGQRKNRGKKDE